MDLGFSLMSLTTSVCVLLSEWISFFLVAVPPRSRRTFAELLIGSMLNPEGWVTRAIGAICREAHWTTYYKLIERAQVSVGNLAIESVQNQGRLIGNGGTFACMHNGCNCQAASA
ncbi:MAG: hypothetical protein IPI02_12165 [Sterolibacteriaceae bacterium]|nr:hypothetical protein [Sterolibacteriaceae bacterium]